MSREHGTPARYVWGPDEQDVPGAGCHCAKCTASRRVGEGHRRRMRAYGCWQPYVDAEPAREHARLLGRCGIGWKRAAALAGVSTGAMSKLLYGGPGDRPPTRRIRPDTAARILAVDPFPVNRGDRALAEATATRRRLQALVAIGWAKAQLAARLGMTGSNFGKTMERAQVVIATERAVCALYDELWDTRPPETSHWEKISAARARNYAAARGWALPCEWLDSEIGDPEAVPSGRRLHDGPPRGPELAAEAVELLGYGLTREQAAARLGVARNTVDAVLAQAARVSQACQTQLTTVA
jgi:hypothetical protein